MPQTYRRHAYLRSREEVRRVDLSLVLPTKDEGRGFLELYRLNQPCDGFSPLKRWTMALAASLNSVSRRSTSLARASAAARTAWASALRVAASALAASS